MPLIIEGKVSFYRPTLAATIARLKVLELLRIHCLAHQLSLELSWSLTSVCQRGSFPVLSLSDGRSMEDKKRDSRYPPWVPWRSFPPDRRKPMVAGLSLQPPTVASTSGSAKQLELDLPNKSTKKLAKYAHIPDTFTSVDQVTNALRESGLESSNLILGIDFTKSNEWTGKHSFNNRSLHAIGAEPNPYEKAITVVGKALAPFDEDNLIPCFGFGDATTHDEGVFSFNSDGVLCHGFEEVLARYREITPKLVLSGPTSFGPIIEAAIDIVEETGGQFHVLVIIADGQVTRSINTDKGNLSKQEMETINAIVSASSYALSIVLVGVGDGPWEDMQKFDDKIPARNFDNFQFVNYTSIMEKTASSEEKDALFALAALMEIPIQYKAAIELNLLNQKTGKPRRVVPHSPPGQPRRQGSTLPSSLSNEPSQPSQVCPICLDKAKDLAFGCGHMTCRDCGQPLMSCPICRQRITTRLRLYTG